MAIWLIWKKSVECPNGNSVAKSPYLINCDSVTNSCQISIWLITHKLKRKRNPRCFKFTITKKCRTAHVSFVAGEAGIGKSCSMAMLVMDWAEGRVEQDVQRGGDEPERKQFKPEIGLLQFDFVFLIQLRYVSKNIPLERVIIQQHGRLKSRKAKEENLREILDGATGSKVLLLFDGYDEYKKGTNTDIDDAIADTIGDCFLIVTSRPGDYMKKVDRDQLDGEIIITGLSPENVQKCSAKYLGSLALSQSLLHKVEKLASTNCCASLLYC